MDLLTQGLLGAACAGSAAEREETRVATVIGLAAGMLADADILIQSAEDPLLNLDYHRHFTHALAFIPVGALIAALLLWPVLRKRLGPARLYRLALLGYLPSGLIDACTGYGTFLLWPFSDARIALHLISIIDPIFTVILLLSVTFALIRKTPRFAHIGIGLCCLYLVLAFVQQQRALTSGSGLARTRGHTIQRIIARPSFGNIVLWKTLYTADESIYVDAVRPGLTRTRVYEGQSVTHFQPERDAPARGIAAGTELYNDILRFRKFSSDWIGVHPDRPEILGDIRYSMLPDSALPLWGIVLDAERAERHAEFRSYRTLAPAERTRFMLMLRGDAPSDGTEP